MRREALGMKRLILDAPVVCANRTRAVLSCEKGDYMERILFLLFILYSLFVGSPLPAAAESQTWKVRPGDNLDIIATTLEIPREEIKKHNPGVLESNLQIN